MNLFQQLRDWIRPSTVKCNDDLETRLQASQMQDQFDAHIPEKRHKVPIFEHTFNPVIMVTANLQLIKGFRFQFGLPLSEYFATSHAWNLPNSGTASQNPNPMMMMQPPQKPTYTFTTQLVQDIRGQEPYTVMMGKLDSEGRIDAIFVRKLLDNLSLKLSGNFLSSDVEKGVIGAQLQLEHQDSMSVFKLSKAMWGYSFNQRIHPNLILGFDYNYLTQHKMSLWGYGLKAFINNHSLFANFVGAQKQYNLGYIIPIKRGTQFVAHYRYEQHQKQSVTILGLKQRYDQSQILATVNSKGQISTCLSLRNPSYSLKLCALIDYMKDKYSFGYGITLGQAV